MLSGMFQAQNYISTALYMLVLTLEGEGIVCIPLSV